MREKKRRKEIGIIETFLHAMHVFTHDLISSLLKHGGVNRITPIFQVEKLRPRGGKTFALDNVLVGWDCSPGLLTSEIRVLPSIPRRAPVLGACRWRCEAVGGCTVMRRTPVRRCGRSHAGRCRPSVSQARRESYSRP